MARVLIAEDYPPLAKVIAIAVQREGHEVERVGSVARALSLDGSFQLGVLDVELPDGLGTDLAKRLIRERRLESVIFFTSTRDQALTRAAERLGHLVSKEAGIDELILWVRRELCQRERLAQVVGETPRRSVALAKRSGTHKRYSGK